MTYVNNQMEEQGLEGRLRTQARTVALGRHRSNQWGVSGCMHRSASIKTIEMLAIRFYSSFVGLFHMRSH